MKEQHPEILFEEFMSIYGDGLSTNCPILTGNSLKEQPVLEAVYAEDRETLIDYECSGGVVYINVFGKKDYHYECTRCPIKK